MVQHLARLAWSTQPRPVARVDTAASLTSLITRTLRVTPTLNLAVGAREHALLVHQEAVLALAHGLVEVDLALLVGVAGESGAWVVTLLVLSVAGRGKRTVLVAGTSLGHLRQGGWAGAAWVRSAGLLRLTNVTLRTLTSGLVEDNRADGILAASSAEAAGVNTPAPVTRLGHCAVKISATFSI